MATVGDGFKDIFLAGIGVMAVTAEKGKELVDQLIAKGELTVDQGRQINTELKHKAADAASAVREDLLEVRMAAMTSEERAAFVAKAADIAQRADEKEKAAAAVRVGDASAVKAGPAAAGEAACGPASPDPACAAPQESGSAGSETTSRAPGA